MDLKTGFVNNSFIFLVRIEYRFSGDKVKRVVNHLLHQASFYPLNPPSQKLSYDAGLAERFAALPIVPNIFIISSSAKYFTRVSAYFVRTKSNTQHHYYYELI